MNYLSGVIFTGIKSTKNFISQFIPKENSVFGNVVRKTVEIAKGVFIGVSPFIINISPHYLSKMTNIRFFSLIGLGTAAIFQLRPQRIGIERTISEVIMVGNILGILDLVGILPIEREFRVVVDGLLLLITAVGSGRAIYEGTNRMISIWNSKEKSTTSKVSDFISGTILTTVGTINLEKSLSYSFSLISGFQKIQDLDPEQMNAVIKHRSMAEFSKDHKCTAVIIDGSGKSRDAFESNPHPFSEELYKHCKTRSYTVSTPDQFCAALEDSKVHFEGSIEILSLQGHASNQALLLDDNYRFIGSQQEIKCMQDSLSLDAQIGLLGCNTATPRPHGKLTLTEKISEQLPGKTVTGFNWFYNPFFTTTQWVKSRFIHENYTPFSKTSVIKKN